MASYNWIWEVRLKKHHLLVSQNFRKTAITKIAFLVMYRLSSFNAKKLTLVEPLLSNGSIYFKVLTSKLVGNHSQEGIKWFNFGRPLTYVFLKSNIYSFILIWFIHICFSSSLNFHHLKVSKSRKQFIVSSILPKNER